MVVYPPAARPDGAVADDAPSRSSTTGCGTGTSASRARATVFDRSRRVVEPRGRRLAVHAARAGPHRHARRRSTSRRSSTPTARAARRGWMLPSSPTADDGSSASSPASRDRADRGRLRHDRRRLRVAAARSPTDRRRRRRSPRHRTRSATGSDRERRRGRRTTRRRHRGVRRGEQHVAEVRRSAVHRRSLHRGAPAATRCS